MPWQYACMPTQEEIEQALQVYGPQSVTSDGTTVVNRSIDDLNKAAQAISTTKKLSNPFKRIVRFQGDGAISRE